MTDLLTLILSDFRYFIGTIILICWVGMVTTFTAVTIINAIRGKGVVRK